MEHDHLQSAGNACPERRSFGKTPVPAPAPRSCHRERRCCDCCGARRKRRNIIGLAQRRRWFEEPSSLQGDAMAGYVNAPANAREICGLQSQMKPSIHRVCQARHPDCGGSGRVRLAARRLLLRNLSARLYRARWGTGADPGRLHPGAGSDRARHALDRGDRQRRGVLLHLPAQPSGKWVSCRSRWSTSGSLPSISTSNRRVERLANYGLKDGRVFDFVSRTTADRRQGRRLSQRDVQAFLAHDRARCPALRCA